MAVASIPGFNVNKIGKDKYSVAVNNGNMGACVVNKDQLKQLADAYGGKVNDGSTAKKIIGGLALAGAVTAAVVYRKNIGDFFRGLKTDKVGNSIKKGWNSFTSSVRNLFAKKEKVNNAMFEESILKEYNRVKKEYLVDFAKNATLNPSGLSKKEWRSKLSKAFGAMNVH